ncbi:putative discs large log 5a [Trichonephila clavata]|uniref:Putative discs large log 5a n=1 Tax=Trichonephila clavata TaxID=2740835 RepID=A0A8X6GBT4_TRICU|nr:putative discs large log 5a [Trichonephila clavata]
MYHGKIRKRSCILPQIPCPIAGTKIKPPFLPGILPGRHVNASKEDPCREVKDSRYLIEKVTTKAAKEMFEHALKIESEYKQLINAVIPGSNLAYMCTQVKSCVEEEQSKALWVPSGSL